jgi:NADH-quinone oxidoreductase subunit L
MIGLGVVVVALVCIALTPGSLNERLATGMLSALMEQARPAGTLTDAHGVFLSSWLWPNEHAAHVASIVAPVSLIAIGTALAGFCLATLMYGLRRLDPAEVRRQFAPLYGFLLNKWWFDELYDWLFVRPTHLIAGRVSAIDRSWIDRLIDGLAWLAASFAKTWDRIADQTIVDGFVNSLASRTYSVGLAFRNVQTGRLRQYVMFIIVGAVAIFILISFFWNPASLAR